MHAIHDKIAQWVRIATGLYLLHHIHKKLVPNLQRLQIVAFHPLLDGGGLDHAHPHHENLPLSHLRHRVEELQLQEIQLLGRQQRHRSRILKNDLIGSLPLLQKKRIDQLHPPLPVHENTAHLYVPVHRAPTVQVRETTNDLLENSANLLLGKRTALLTASLDLIEQRIRVKIVHDSVSFHRSRAKVRVLC